MKDQYVLYANTSTLALLNHLYANYSNITAKDLVDNLNKMNEQYDVNLSIETLFTRLEDCVDFAQAGGTPITTEQVVTSALNAIQRTGVFAEDVKIWKCPEVDRTYPQLKVFFTTAYQEIHESQSTANTYNQVNNAEQI